MTKPQSDTVAADERLFHERLIALADDRELLVPALSAFLQEMPIGSKRYRLAKLVAELEAGVAPQQLYRAEDVDIWLPLLSKGPPDGSTRFLNDVFEETSRALIARVKNVRIFAYPFAVLLLAIAVVVFLCVVVVPMFHEMYLDFDIELPALTLWTLKLSNAIRFHPLLAICAIVALLGCLYGLFRLMRRVQDSSRLLDSLTNGSSHQVLTMASFLRRLVDGLRVDLPLSSALRLAGKTNGTPWLEREADILARQVDQSQTSSTPWSTALPSTVFYALRTGSDQGPNVPLLEALADIYSERVDARFDWSTSMLPVLGILFVGGVVLFVVLALYLPLVMLINGLM